MSTNLIHVYYRLNKLHKCRRQFRLVVPLRTTSAVLLVANMVNAEHRLHTGQFQATVTMILVMLKNIFCTMFFGCFKTLFFVCFFVLLCGHY